MKRVQKRRTVSMRGTTYARLGNLMVERNKALDLDPENAPTPPPLDDRNPKEWTRSNVLEDLIARACEDAGVDEVLAVPERQVKPASAPVIGEPIGGIWTF